MKGKTIVWIFFLLLTLILSACVPTTFTSPTEIHLDPDDQVEQAVIAVDGNGRSHIAGVANDRIIYYRTRFGKTITEFEMLMGGSGPDWKQYSPDIAALNNGAAYIVWVEQRGGPEKFACWGYVPLYPPVGGYDRNCSHLDTTIQTTGNVRVVSNGYSVYAIYDRKYLTDGMGRIGALMYKELTDPTNTGVAYDYINYSETGYIYGLDMVIYNADKLHIAILDNYTVSVGPPYTDRLFYRSNYTTQADGTMTQGWLPITTGLSLGEDVDPSISIYTDYEDGPRVGIASIWTTAGIDDIYIDSCTVNGCEYVGSHLVNLPSSWNSHSVIDDLEIQGRGEELFLSFIGDNSPSAAPQVYYTDAFDTTIFMEASDGSATFKFDLEMVLLAPRPESPTSSAMPAISWGESDFVTATYYSAGFLSDVVKISEDQCLDSLLSGDVGSNGYYYAGVWDACSNTWFTTQVWKTQLPIIVK